MSLLWYHVTPVISCHSCYIMSDLWYAILLLLYHVTLVISCHSCDNMSLMWYVISLLWYHELTNQYINACMGERMNRYELNYIKRWQDLYKKMDPIFVLYQFVMFFQNLLQKKILWSFLYKTHSHILI